MIKLKSIKNLIKYSSWDLVSIAVSDSFNNSFSFYNSIWPEVWNLSDVSVRNLVKNSIIDEIND